MADQPVTLAQLETLLTSRTKQFDERFAMLTKHVDETLDERFAMHTKHFDEKLETLRIDLIEHVEKIETRLLTAFPNWAGPIAQRMGEYEASRASYASRLAEIESRLYDLERRRGPQA